MGLISRSDFHFTYTAITKGELFCLENAKWFKGENPDHKFITYASNAFTLPPQYFLFICFARYTIVYCLQIYLESVDNFLSFIYFIFTLLREREREKLFVGRIFNFSSNNYLMKSWCAACCELISANSSRIQRELKTGNFLTRMSH